MTKLQAGCSRLYFTRRHIPCLHRHDCLTVGNLPQSPLRCARPNSCWLQARWRGIGEASMPSVPLFGAIGLICTVVVLLAIGIVTLLSPSGLPGVIGMGTEPTAASHSPPQQTIDPGTPLAPEAQATATAA